MIVVLQQVVLLKTELDKNCKNSRNPIKRLYRKFVMNKLIKRIEYLKDVVLDIGILTEFGEFCTVVDRYSSTTIDQYNIKIIEIDDMSISIKYNKNRIVVRYISEDGNNIEKIYDNSEISYNNATNTDDNYTHDILERLHYTIYNTVSEYIKS